MQEINHRMAKGIIWMVAARLMDRLIGICSTLILARLLVPGDFGLVAMATAIGGVLDLLGAFSFDMALIHNKNAQRRHYDTVWTFNVLLGLFCAVALIVLAEPAAGFYREPRLTAVMYVLSISYVVGSFNNIGVVAFRKDLNFQQEFKFIFSRRIITFIVTITSAIYFQSYWALLFGMTVGRIASMLLSYTMHEYRPRFSLVATPELFRFSKWLLVNNALSFLLHNGCTFIIGRMYGATALGIYSVAYEISSLPSTELVAPINRVAFPGFSKMKSVSEISQSYLKLVGMISLIILPVGVGIAAVADPLVRTLLGEKWISAIPLIQLLAIYGAIAATQGNNGTVWLSLGRPLDTTILATFFLLVLFPSLYFFLKAFGGIGAGYAYLFATFITLPYGLIVTKRMLQFEWMSLWVTVWRPLVSVSFMYGGVKLVEFYLVNSPSLIRLLVGTAAGAFVYTASVLGLWSITRRPPGAERYVIDSLLPVLRSRIFDKAESRG